MTQINAYNNLAGVGPAESPQMNSELALFGSECSSHLEGLNPLYKFFFYSNIHLSLTWY
jgi:hypothetical protein